MHVCIGAVNRRFYPASYIDCFRHQANLRPDTYICALGNRRQ
jgi:hypothetical protein